MGDTGHMSPLIVALVTGFTSFTYIFTVKFESEQYLLNYASFHSLPLSEEEMCETAGPEYREREYRE